MLPLGHLDKVLALQLVWLTMQSTMTNQGTYVYGIVFNIVHLHSFVCTLYTIHRLAILYILLHLSLDVCIINWPLTVPCLSYRVYCILGDGETAEGSVWEAMSFASYYKLDNLCIILDINRLGQSEAAMLGHNMEVYRKRCDAFG